MPTAEEHYDRGVDLFAEGKYGEAIAAYDAALSVDPGFVDACMGWPWRTRRTATSKRRSMPPRGSPKSPDDHRIHRLVRDLPASRAHAEAEAAANQARVLSGSSSWRSLERCHVAGRKPWATR
jgi:hypothetical protein